MRVYGRNSFQNNIIDLRVDIIIEFDWFTDLIVDFWSKNQENFGSKLIDLELILQNTKDVERILIALKDNYMIKTIRLNTMNKVEESTVRTAQEFRQKRVSTEIGINWSDRRFRICDKKTVELFYPDKV